MKKPLKIFLGVAGVLALVGICFACLSIYAKKEINKPKFELPEIGEEQSVSPLPETKEEAFDYVAKLYNGSVTADDVEISFHTDVHTTEGDKVTPFTDSDNAVLSRVLETAQGALGELYPKSENELVKSAKNIPRLDFTAADITEFTASKGREDENGEIVDEGNYYITLTVNPERLDKKAMLDGEIRKSVEKELSSALKIKSLDIVPEGYAVSFTVSAYNDMLTHAEFKRNVKIKAEVDFTQEYKALDEETAQLEIPYETLQSVDLFHYGIHFTERQIAVQKNDMQALPLEVRVNAETTKDEYKLSFETSKDGILEIDPDGVVTVKGTQKEPITVKATLEYDGHTYTDELIVYATEMEVKTDEQNGN